jgi:replication factor C subunit 2/4
MASVDPSIAATPWVERYRPKSLKDVSHQNEVVATLQNAVQTGRLPHLLLYGPPGSGKVGYSIWLVCHVCLSLLK